MVMGFNSWEEVGDYEAIQYEIDTLKEQLRICMEDKKRLVKSFNELDDRYNYLVRRMTDEELDEIRARKKS